MASSIEKVAVELAGNEAFVVFAGTGICTEAGLPAWGELLRSLKEACHIQTKETFDNPDEYPELAQKFYDQLVAERREHEYNAILKNQLRPRKSFYTSQELEIVETSGRVVTTNFDATFEHAIRKIAPSGIRHK